MDACTSLSEDRFLDLLWTQAQWRCASSQAVLYACACTSRLTACAQVRAVRTRQGQRRICSRGHS